MTPRRAALISACAALTAIAGCSSSGAGYKTSAPPTSSAPATTTPAVPTSSASPRPSAHSLTAAPPSSTTAGGGPAAAATSSPQRPRPGAASTFTTTCSKLTVRVLPGGAERGAEIAAVQYVNDGSATCTIAGYPTAMLLRNGQLIGQPSQPDGAAISTMTLRPGDTAESLLSDFSTCQAPLSDHVRVSLPKLAGATPSPVIRPARLRACTLRTASVGLPA